MHVLDRPPIRINSRAKSASKAAFSVQYTDITLELKVHDLLNRSQQEGLLTHLCCLYVSPQHYCALYWFSEMRSDWHGSPEGGTPVFYETLFRQSLQLFFLVYCISGRFRMRRGIAVGEATAPLVHYAQVHGH